MRCCLKFDDKELSQKGYSQQEILYIRNDEILEQKARVITRLIHQLEKFIQHAKVTSRAEDALLQKQKA